MTELAVREVPFAQFEAEVAKAAGVRSVADRDQVRYLASYLRDEAMGATWMVVERPYVDRHYLEEYAGYYASRLRPPPSHTTRIHFFSGVLSRSASFFTDALKQAVDSGLDKAAQALQEDYLGFTVVRPLGAAPIGRTILRPYKGDSQRIYGPAETEHRVHICGLGLSVRGLPFQQQDVAVGACATTALWSTLSRSVRADGGRAPTPLAVTAAATKFAVTGRGLPAADGLDLNQMLAAVRAFGYSPLVTSPLKEDTGAAFLAAITTYLRSGIPVILRIFDGSSEGHALTLSGYREATTDRLELATRRKRPLKVPGPVHFYAHDDRLGPYARLEINGPSDPDPDGDRRLTVKFKPRSDESIFDKFKSSAILTNAIVPLYPKLRLNASDLIAYALEVLPLMEEVAGSELRDDLLVEPRFLLGGAYLEELYSAHPAADQVALHLHLSRYVGLLRFRVGSTRLADVLCDTTDIRRGSNLPHDHILAIVRHDAGADALKASAKVLDLDDRVWPA